MDIAGHIRSGLAASGCDPVCVLKLASPDAFRQAFAEDADRRHLILYDPAETAVARAMELGHPPSEALEQWKRHTSILLSTYRKNRSMIVFASVPGITAGPTLFWTALSRHFALANIPAETGLTARLARRTSWQDVLARQAVTMDPEASRLNGEIEAGALQLTERLYNADAAFADIEEIRAALAKMQADEAQKRLDAQQAERDLLVRQLSNVQEELKTQFSAAATAQELQGQLAHLHDQLHLRDTEIHDLRTSTSWKITGPMRGVKRILTG